MNKGLHELFAPTQVSIAPSAGRSCKTPFDRKRGFGFGITTVRENANPCPHDGAGVILGVKIKDAPPD
jgi:hypothetical protein